MRGAGRLRGWPTHCGFCKRLVRSSFLIFPASLAEACGSRTSETIPQVPLLARCYTPDQHRFGVSGAKNCPLCTIPVFMRLFRCSCSTRFAFWIGCTFHLFVRLRITGRKQPFVPLQSLAQQSAILLASAHRYAIALFYLRLMVKQRRGLLGVQ